MFTPIARGRPAGANSRPGPAHRADNGRNNGGDRDSDGDRTNDDGARYRPSVPRLSRRGRHAAGPRLSRRWRLVPIIAAGSVLIGGVALAAPSLRGVHYRVSAPVTVQALGVDHNAPAVGQTITAGAKVVAERAQTFDAVVLAVRDQVGRIQDFPATTNWRLSTKQRVYTASRSFAAPGRYTYWFAYLRGARWTNLAPTGSFTVRSGPAGPAAGAPNPTPLPTLSTPPTTSAPSPRASTTTAPKPTATAGTSTSSTRTSTATSNPAPSTSSATAAAATGTLKPLGVPGTWTYKFGDEFSAPVAWGNTWADSSSAEADNGHGNLGNQQLEWNHKANCTTSGGVLSLTAKPDSITSPSGQHYNWSSCLLSSSPSYAFRYGYIEIRAQLPGPKGFWPAFWTWQASGNNQWTETDVFEFYSDNHSRLYLTQHSGAGGGTVYDMPFDPTTGFHTYGADIAPDGTRFYVDGKLVHTAPGTSTGLTNIIIDNFVYSKIPPAAGTTGVMKVDYVRAWQH